MSLSEQHCRGVILLRQFRPSGLLSLLPTQQGTRLHFLWDFGGSTPLPTFIFYPLYSRPGNSDSNTLVESLVNEKRRWNRKVLLVVMRGGQKKKPVIIHFFLGCCLILRRGGLSIERRGYFSVSLSFFVIYDKFIY